MPAWPKSLIWRLTCWAFLLFLVSIPVLWFAFLKGAERVSENVVDTQILEFGDQLRGYRAAALSSANLDRSDDGFNVSAPLLIGDADWVWQFSVGERIQARSDLLELSRLSLPLSLAPAAPEFILQDIETSIGPMRVAGRAIRETGLAGQPQLVHYVVGLIESRYSDRVEEHNVRLRELIYLGVLPISIGILGMLILVVFTLRGTFVRLDEAIARYEQSGGSDIEGRFPNEIQTLVDRTNAILRQNQRLVDRTRKYVSKIAHDINHPLAILKNALRGEVDQNQAERQIQRMSGLIDRYASLARTIGPGTQTRRAVDVAPVLADIAAGFAIMYRRKPIEIKHVCPEGLRVVMPQYDLETMLSNLVSNAQKHAESKVRIAESAHSALRLIVEDDGPGIAEDQRNAALKWGKRLDEAPPGTGFGLSIVSDIAELYEGSVSLDSSLELGGLKAVIDLPVTIASADH